MFRPQEISATDTRKYLSQIISKVQYSSKSFVVKSYRKPVVRIVKEDYIAILEQVLGKKTVGQILEISGNDNLFDATKIIEIKKVFQRRLSGPPQPKPQPKQQTQPQPKAQPQKPAPQPQKPKPAPAPKPQTTSQSSKTQPKKNPTSHLTPPTSNRSRGVLLLSNGKSYE